MIKTIARWVMAVFMMMVGVTHFIRPDGFVAIVPAFLPAPLLLVYISGFFEFLGGLGLLIPKVKRAAAWGLVALYIAVFPANLNMAVNHLPFNGHPVEPLFLWLRLPIQFGLIAWAYWLTRPDYGTGQTANR